MNNKQWKQKFRDILFHTPVKYLELEDFISALLDQREAEIRKETIEAVLPSKVGYIQHMQSKRAYDEGNGWDNCRQSIIDKAKEKFNIDL